MCQVLTHCGFFGVSLDGNCAYVHWGSFTSNSRSVRLAIWFTWFSEPHECIQHLAVTRRSPIQLWTGATLLNFSDRANHDERTPYTVCKSCWLMSRFFLSCLRAGINPFSRVADHRNLAIKEVWCFLAHIAPVGCRECNFLHHWAFFYRHISAAITENPIFFNNFAINCWIHIK